MVRFIVRNKATGKYFKKTAFGGKSQPKWVSSADDATLITTSTAATFATRHVDGEYSACFARLFPTKFSVEVIKVGVLIFPIGVQPFIDGVLNNDNS